MKKALILAAVAASAISSQANATAACTGGAGGNYNVTTTANLFVKTAFTVKCSANVVSNYSENGTALGVVAGSSKGKNYFGGGTAGGGIAAVGTCATTGCSTTEITDTASAAKRDAS